MGTKTEWSFSISRVGEPHFRRRKEIFKRYPEIENLFGYDSRTSYIVIGVVLAQFSIAILLQNYAVQYWTAILVATAYAVGAVLNHWCAMAIHECSHNLAASTPNKNRWTAILANFPIILPGAISFCRYHLGHHTYLGIEKKDNDLPSRLEMKWVGNSSFKKAIWLLFYFFFATLARGFVNRPNKWEFINILVQTAVNSLILLLIGKVAFCYLLLSTFFAFSIHPVAGHYLHEHYSFTSDHQETYSYYGPLNWVTFNVGYHNEHHDFMNIPGSRLPELKKIASEYYDPLHHHNSWSQIIFKFISDTSLGHFSRIVRDQDVFRASRTQISQVQMGSYGNRI